MFFLYTQRLIQANATGIILLALIVTPFVISAIVKKSKISDAEEIKNRYPDGFRKVMRYSAYDSSISYETAKEVIQKVYLISAAQREHDEIQWKKEEENRFREKVKELRSACSNASSGHTDEYIVSNENMIRQHEKYYSLANSIIKDNPLGIKEVCGSLPTVLSINDVYNIINQESTIRAKQADTVEKNAELKRLNAQLDELDKKYHMGIHAACYKYGWSTSNPEHIKFLLKIPGELAELQEQRENHILNDKERLTSFVVKAKEFLNKHDLNTSKYFYHKWYGVRVSKRVFDIIAENEALAKHLDYVAKQQNDFAQETRSIIDDVFEGWGCYPYQFEMEYEDDYSNVATHNMTVWQAFKESCCFDDTVSYDYYPRFKDNRVFRSQLEGTYSYKSGAWDKVLSFLSTIKDKYGDELFVIIANTDHLSDYAYKNNFGYIQTQLNKLGINYGETDPRKGESKNKKYVVLDIITENANLKQYCESLFHYRHVEQIKNIEGSTGVVFISMLKCYDGSEVEELNKEKVQEREDALRRAKEEEARRQQERRDLSEAKDISIIYPVGFARYFPGISSSSIDASQAKLIIQYKRAIRDYEETLSRLREAVSSWNTEGGLHHYFFYYYYPSRFTDISIDSRAARRLIYEFKDGYSHDKVKELIVNKLQSTFNASDLAKMCFACIPASTISVNRLRYEDFANDVCQALNMTNAFEHVTIVKEKTPSYLGGMDKAVYSCDNTFFEGKFVILFDDVLTTGNSIISMKNNLEQIGATVICALSIGRTYSDWNGNIQRPHPFTGQI